MVFFFCPEAPATEKRRRKEAGTPPTPGARSRKEQSKTPKPKAEEALDSVEEQSAAGQSPLALVLPPQPGRVCWVLREHSSPYVGLTHQSLGVRALEIRAALFYQELEVFSMKIKTAPRSPGGSPWLS